MLQFGTEEDGAEEEEDEEEEGGDTNCVALSPVNNLMMWRLSSIVRLNEC